MRGLVDDLASPHPLGGVLPALFQEDPFTQRFVSAFDEVLAPVFCTLDNLEAYFDPRLAPEDFVAWLAEWVGLSLDENWPLERQRALIAQAGDLNRWRGTAKGRAAQVALYTGVEPEIEETGGCEWSGTPETKPPGNDLAHVVIRIRVPDPSKIDEQRINAIVAASKPAHVIHEIEVLSP